MNFKPRHQRTESGSSVHSSLWRLCFQPQICSETKHRVLKFVTLELKVEDHLRERLLLLLLGPYFHAYELFINCQPVLGEFFICFSLLLFVLHVYEAITTDHPFPGPHFCHELLSSTVCVQKPLTAVKDHPQQLCFRDFERWSRVLKCIPKMLKASFNLLLKCFIYIYIYN